MTTLLKVQSFLAGIADAGRELWDRGLRAKGAGGEPELRTVVQLCSDLTGQKGEALGTALAREVGNAYKRLDAGGRLSFFRMLLEDYSPDAAALGVAVAGWQANPNPASAQRLFETAEAPRQELLRAINMAPGGTAAVVAMRRDLLGLLPEHPELAPVDADFVHLLSSWFNRGFLVLERINWKSPAHILEKLIAYEAVHAIQSWDDLRGRLEDDRRCFAFFHPALPDEPLIFVEVALVNGIASAVRPLIAPDRAKGDAKTADTAIFYSISNCQEGLRGISFGNFLIKQVVVELQAELSNLKTFATLSPLPGFLAWLKRLRAGKEGIELNEELAKTLETLDGDGWPNDAVLPETLRRPFMTLAAHYLLKAKRQGRPLDPVARFHLGNGAALERINWLGDVSSKGLHEAAGLMVNYLYDLRRIERRHEAFANQGVVACSKEVQALADAAIGRPAKSG